MKRFRTLLILSLAIIGLSTANFAAAVNTKPARTLDEQVYHKLRGLPNYNVFDNITWQVSGDTVTLTGKVYTLGTKRDASAAIKGIPGVGNVVNKIEELPPSSMDDQIRRAALLTFTSRGPGQYFGEPNPDVHIIVENGRLTLEGFVSRKADSDTLNVLANSLTGVFQVTNNLVVGERKFS